VALVAGGALAVAVALAGCSSSSTGVEHGGSTAVVATDPVDYSAPGPYPVGAVELTSGGAEPSPIYAWYPADPERLDEGTPVSGYSSAVAFPESLRDLLPEELVQEVPLALTADAPIAEGSFPIVVFSHGYGTHPQYSAAQLAHLASWGFVVAAPDHRSRDLAAVATGTDRRGDDDVADLRTAIKVVRAEAQGRGRFAGSVDIEAVAALGHSAGGGAVARMIPDDDIDTFIGLAPAPPFDVPAEVGDQAALAELYADRPPPELPVMLIAADRDIAVPLVAVDAEYDWLVAPKRYAVLADAGHNSFTDLCGPIRDRGGLGPLADRLPSVAAMLRLADDGCVTGYLDPQLGHAVVNHLVVAQLRWVFGLDPSEEALAPDFVTSLFPGALDRYESDPPVAGQG